jgi:hypothetical protein
MADITQTSGVEVRYFHMNGLNLALYDCTTVASTQTIKTPFNTIVNVLISSITTTVTPNFYWSASGGTVTLYTSSAIECKILVMGY